MARENDKSPTAKYLNCRERRTSTNRKKEIRGCSVDGGSSRHYPSSPTVVTPDLLRRLYLIRSTSSSILIHLSHFPEVDTPGSILLDSYED
ncbi:hypothetical protein AVEN_216129-1 [Araneus ventricosus]|uniref:Uncharacterized protein n=1 Tax=Araneus ventricosus TaxID=182803 RepID=A0A4Y2NAE1_ARAVE|nr:hypothetical protein AVEN_216129-1 [Araneus ventricosus]